MGVKFKAPPGMLYSAFQGSPTAEAIWVPSPHASVQKVTIPWVPDPILDPDIYNVVEGPPVEVGVDVGVGEGVGVGVGVVI